MAVPTHVLQYDDGTVVIFDSYGDISEFATTLEIFDGTETYALILWALPPGMDYDEAVAAGLDGEYIQAAGRADAMTVEICKPDGAQWGVDRVRYVIGHPHDDSETALDVPIVLPTHTEIRSRHEIFQADEASQLFYSYYKTGDIPPGYTLRPEQGFPATGPSVDLRGQVPGPR